MKKAEKKTAVRTPPGGWVYGVTLKQLRARTTRHRMNLDDFDMGHFLVCRAPKKQMISLGDKVKFPWCEVVCVFRAAGYFNSAAEALCARIEKAMRGRTIHPDDPECDCSACLLAQALATLRANAWIPVSERLPEKVEDGEDFYPCLISAGGVVREALWDGDGFFLNEGMGEVIADAWMPLPAPYGGGE